MDFGQEAATALEQYAKAADKLRALAQYDGLAAYVMLMPDLDLDRVSSSKT